MNCKKYKKKLIIGLCLLLYFIIIRTIDMKILIGESFSIILTIIIGVVCLILILPYVKCIGDYNNINKPRF